MKLEIYKPSPQLAPYVKYYWLLEADTTQLDDATHRIIPNGLTELFFKYGDNFVCSGNGVVEYSSPRVSLCGQRNTYYDITQLGKTKLISALFTPVGATLFIPFSFWEIVNESVDIDDIYPHQADNLICKISESLSSFEKIRIIEEFLIGILNSSIRKEFPLMDALLDHVTGLEGQVSIDSLCSTFNINFKYIERKFLEYIGMPPITFMRIVRFQNVLRKFKQYRDNLTQLAYECGYYDQAHFNKEFKTFSGLTPGEYFSKCEVYSDLFFN